MGRPKSKGCNTCRRRRVKCDERVPGCERCEVAGYECEGYLKDFRFVNKVPCSVQSVRQSTLLKDGQLRGVSISAVLPDLSLSGFKDNICITFLLSTLSLYSTFPEPWMRSHARDSTSLTAQYSLRALGSIYFGRKHHRNEILNEGFLWYGIALRCLSKQLEDPVMARSLSSLSSATMLQIYEYISPSSESAWLTHAGGIGRLLELRGPDMHQGYVERQILESNRFAIFLECWIKGKRCFLEDTRWKCVPWALEPATKTSISYLEDILYDLPGMTEESKKLLDPDLDSVSKEIIRHKLSTSIVEHLDQINKWRSQWEDKNSHSYKETSVPLHTGNTTPFQTMMCFSSVVQANELLSYNATLLLFLKLGGEMNVDFSEIYTSCYSLSYNNTVNAIGTFGASWDNVRAVATEICKIVVFCLSAQHDVPPAFLFFPIRVASLGLAPESPESQWLEKLPKQIAEWTGLAMGSGIPSPAKSVFTPCRARAICSTNSRDQN